MNIRVRANVTMPDMRISTDVIDFEEVKCGECKVVTVQLHNHQKVSCQWAAVLASKDQKKVSRYFIFMGSCKHERFIYLTFNIENSLMTFLVLNQPAMSSLRSMVCIMFEMTLVYYHSPGSFTSSAHQISLGSLYSLYSHCI